MMKFSSCKIVAYCALTSLATSIDDVYAWVQVVRPTNNKKTLTIIATQITSQQKGIFVELPIKKQQQQQLFDKRNSATALRGKLDDDEDDNDDDDDDDDDDCIDESLPLAKGVDSVSWLPSVVGKLGSIDNFTLTQPYSEILPLYTSNDVYIPHNTQQIIEISETKYREMYSDMLLNGTKQIAAVLSHPTDDSRFASMASLLELDDLKEVCDENNGQTKYICNHTVTGRVVLHRIINPQDWDSGTTYLRVEGTIIDDSGNHRNHQQQQQQQQSQQIAGTTSTMETTKPDKEIPQTLISTMRIAFTNALIKSGILPNMVQELLLRKRFAELVKLQHTTGVEVRFTIASIGTLCTKSGSGGNSLWQMINLWNRFTFRQVVQRQGEHETKIQEFLNTYNCIKDDETIVPDSIRIQDLSLALRMEYNELRLRMIADLQSLLTEFRLTQQKLLEAKDHTERLKFVRYFITSQIKRLETKRAIQAMFTNKSTSSPLIEISSKTTTISAASASSSSSTLSSSTSTSKISPSSSVQQEDQICGNIAKLQKFKDSLKETTSKSSTQTSFFSDEDAFQ